MQQSSFELGQPRYLLMRPTERRMDQSSLLQFSPLATGEVMYYSDGWKSANLAKTKTIEVPSGDPIFVAVSEIQAIDLGSGFSLVPGNMSSQVPKVSEAGVAALKKHVAPEKYNPPPIIQYKVKISNPDDPTLFRNLVMIVDSGALRSSVPDIAPWIDVEGAGRESMIHSGATVETVCGVVKMELLTKAHLKGVGEYGEPEWDETPLPESTKAAIKVNNPAVLAKLEGVPVIGLNTLIEWGLKIDPAGELVP